MTAAVLQELIVNPDRLNKDTLYDLRNLLARYPYFQTARLLYLKNLYLLHDLTFGAELRKAALYVADRRVLFYLIEGDKFVLESRKAPKEEALKEEPTLDRTLTLINAFLAALPEEAVAFENPDLSTDYTSYLLREEDFEGKKEEDIPKLKGQELIDSFIEKTESEDGIRLQITDDGETSEVLPEEESETDEDGEDESCFTETLAKIYVKQQRYSKALEIIKKLSLKYPKKNAYFADQIRFLEKLIINTKSK